MLNSKNVLRTSKTLLHVTKESMLIRSNNFATKSSVKNFMPHRSKSREYLSSSSMMTKRSTAQSRKSLVQLPEIKETGKNAKKKYRVNVKIIRQSASINKPMTEKKVFNGSSKIFYYIILPGNSSYLVKNCMGHRANWRECQSSVTTLYNFKWQQNTKGIDYSSLSKLSTVKQTVNHFEFNTNLSHKSSMFINMIKYCESLDIEVFQYLPFTVMMQYDNPSYYIQNDNFVNLYKNIESYIIDYQSLIKKKYTVLPRRSAYCSLFPYEEKFGAKTTLAIVSSHYDKKNLWMIKACDLNRGRGIKVANSIQKVQKLVKRFYDGIFKGHADENDMPFTETEMSDDKKRKLMLTNKYKTDTIIVQKYIEKPLLYRGRKFDIRVWVLITHKYEVYAFKEGHLKTCSVKFDINAMDSYVHITNYSLQKHNENFSKFEYGNEVSFADFQQFLNEYHQAYRFTDIFAKIKEIISLTCNSVKNKLNPHDRKNCFELFGYDFMMDIDFNIFLIEINSNPGLEESSPLMTMLIPRMLDDALRLTIDDIYDTKYSYCFEDDIVSSDRSIPYYSPFPVTGYSNAENIWTFVCDLNDKQETRSFSMTKYRKKFVRCTEKVVYEK